MLHTISTWLVVAAFFGAGVFNAVGTSATRRDFVRWGYPSWWCRVTGALEVVTAALVAYPPTRWLGLTLGAVIIAAAIVTVLCYRDYRELAPLGLYVVLLALAGIASEACQGPADDQVQHPAQAQALADA